MAGQPLPTSVFTSDTLSAKGFLIPSRLLARYLVLSGNRIPFCRAGNPCDADRYSSDLHSFTISRIGRLKTEFSCLPGERVAGRGDVVASRWALRFSLSDRADSGVTGPNLGDLRYVVVQQGATLSSHRGLGPHRGDTADCSPTHTRLRVATSKRLRGIRRFAPHGSNGRLPTRTLKGPCWLLLVERYYG